MKKYRGLWPLPGGTEHYVDTLNSLLEYVSKHNPSEEEFIKWFLENFPQAKSEKVIRSYISFVKKLDLIKKEGRKYKLTEIVEEYFKDFSSGKLFQILDDKVMGMHDLLAILSQGPSNTDDLYKKLSNRLGVVWKTKAQIRWRLYWLTNLELVQKRGRVYELTDSGKELAKMTKEVPPAEEREKVQRILKEEELPICISLREAQYDSSHPEKFEKLVAEAFEHLGFKAEHIGVPGDTDVLLHSSLGKETYQVVVDSKTSSRKVISDAQITWPTLKDHKEKHNAKYVAIVGPDFRGGNLEKRAKEYGVTLIKTEDLSDVLKIHSKSPFSMSDLRVLFTHYGLLREEVKDRLKEKAERYQRLVNLVPRIFSEIRSKQELAEAPITAAGLYFILREEYRLDEINKVIDFLSSDLIGALRSEEDEVSTTVEIDTLKQKLKTIIKAIELSEKH